jgi:hypothetical protein
MTILALAYTGFKTLNKLFFTTNSYRSVEHLNDDLLKDIGMYRDSGHIFHLNPAPEKAISNKKASIESAKGTAIFIPSCLEDSSP